MFFFHFDIFFKVKLTYGSNQELPMIRIKWLFKVFLSALKKDIEMFFFRQTRLRHL